VITNKLLPRANAGYEVNILQDWNSKFQKQNISKQSSFDKDLTNSQKINFSVWPKPITFFQKLKSQVPFVVLFDKKIDEADDGLKAYTSLPMNYKLMLRNLRAEGFEKQTTELFDNLTPKRGGFIWPGNFSFDLNNMFK
jgi:hypothetical protein